MTKCITDGKSSDTLRIIQPEPKSGRILIEDVIRMICVHTGIPKVILVGPSRRRDIVYPRQSAMWIARRLTGRGVSEIGRRFGNKNHTTVIYSIRQVEARMLANEGFKAALDAMVQRMEGAC